MEIQNKIIRLSLKQTRKSLNPFMLGTNGNITEINLYISENKGKLALTFQIMSHAQRKKSNQNRKRQ